MEGTRAIFQLMRKASAFGRWLFLLFVKTPKVHTLLGYLVKPFTFQIQVFQS